MQVLYKSNIISINAELLDKPFSPLLKFLKMIIGEKLMRENYIDYNRLRLLKMMNQYVVTINKKVLL